MLRRAGGLLATGLALIGLASYFSSSRLLLRGSSPAVHDANGARLLEELKAQRLQVRQLSAELESSRAALRAARGASAEPAPASAGCTVAAEPAGPPARDLSFIHTTTSLPASAGDLLMMTYATGGVSEMLHNWVLHVARLGLPILVAAMDKDVVRQCSRQRFDCLDWSHTATTADSSYVRGSFGGEHPPHSPPSAPPEGPPHTPPSAPQAFERSACARSTRCCLCSAPECMSSSPT